MKHIVHRITSPLPSNIVQVAGVASANGSTFILRDGSEVTADAIIYCTGYLFAYPFLDEKTGITVDDNYVKTVYKHLINAEHPTMCLIGLPLLVDSLPMFNIQV